MKYYRFLATVAILAISLSLSTGCDNRSQIEKDADKAAGKIGKALN